MLPHVGRTPRPARGVRCSADKRQHRTAKTSAQKQRSPRRSLVSESSKASTHNPAVSLLTSRVWVHPARAAPTNAPPTPFAPAVHPGRSQESPCMSSLTSGLINQVMETTGQSDPPAGARRCEICGRVPPRRRRPAAQFHARSVRRLRAFGDRPLLAAGVPSWSSVCRASLPVADDFFRNRCDRRRN